MKRKDSCARRYLTTRTTISQPNQDQLCQLQDQFFFNYTRILRATKIEWMPIFFHKLQNDIAQTAKFQTRATAIFSNETFPANQQLSSNNNNNKKKNNKNKNNKQKKQCQVQESSRGREQSSVGGCKNM